ncbi:MAG: hypothetical protein ACREQL_15585 [Candidatus Binatia bacterium]
MNCTTRLSAPQEAQVCFFCTSAPLFSAVFAFFSATVSGRPIDG